MLVAIFFVSGASGLIYQIAWVRLLSLTFGVTIYAVSVVVATFMAGLALGSFLGGRLADRVRIPVIWYAFMELAIAGLGAKSVDALDWVQATYVALQPRDADQAVAEIVALRFLLAGAVILVPTTLMGATLPLMVRGSLSLARRVGSRVSWLYASNTSGAILGCLLAGFVLIGGIGLRESIWVAAALNGVAGLAALLVGITTRRRLQVAAQSEATDGAGPAQPAASQAVRVAVVAAFAVQGFVSLAYEVVWTRVFAVLLDGTTYAFTLVLAAVLLGIALGSAAVGPFLSRSLPWPRVYALLQTGVGVLGLAGVLAFARIYGIADRLASLPGLAGLMQGQLGWMTVTAVVVVLPVMLLLGASFPIAARIVVPERAQAGRALGLLYAGNTAGAILGATLAGFVLLPALGSQRAIEILGAANLAIACLLAGAVGWRKLTAPVAIAGVLVAAAVAGSWVPSMYEHMLAGRFPGQALVWVGEGLETTITVVKNPPGTVTMYFNGQSQASTDPSVVWFHRLLAHLPMALHPDPQDVLIVGLGGGTTASALAEHHPQRLDIVELSEITTEGARFFSDVNGDMLSEPFVHLRIDDGRNYLLLTDRKYDVVMADAIHPRTAGTALLYSYDYFHQVAQALKPGGMMAQWLKYDGDYADNDNLRHLITRSFAAAFPYVTLWQNGSLLIGSNQPIDPWDPRLDARWKARNLGATLSEVDLGSPDALRDMYLLSDTEVRAWAGGGPLMTDDHPYAEFFLSLPGGTLGAY
ncbi:MAG TPA: fused MFS/spermidine synthase [Chloroflexota bacterium]|jgi:spermidine synthase